MTIFEQYLNFMYEGDLYFQRLARLAEQKQWKLHDDLPWTSIAEFPDETDSCEQNPLTGFEPYQTMDKKNRRCVNLQRHALEISEIFHGEVLAMLISAQLVNLLSDPEARKFVATQAAEEARHASFFREYLQQFNLPVFSPSQGLHQFITRALQDQRWEHKVLCCNVTIESLAMAQFAWLRTTPVPTLLDQGLRRILEDEARHVKFGVVVLDNHFRTLSPEEQDCLANHVISSVMSLAPSDNHLLLLADHWHWDKHQLLYHLRKRRICRPELYKSRFRQLSLNLRKVGLFTPSAAERLQKWLGEPLAV